MLSEKVVLRKFFRLMTSPKIRKSLIFLQIMIKKFTFCVKFTFMDKFFIWLSMRFVLFKKNKSFTSVFDQVLVNEK